jgi:transposase
MAKNPQPLPNLDLALLNIKDDDVATNKLLMLIEGTYGIGVKESIAKYGYTEQRYYQLLKAFKKDGVIALSNKKTGPHQSSIRTPNIVHQIIRLRFLNPEDSPSVTAQKLKQMGNKISQRSVERTIQEFGLQKKTLSPKS